MLLQVKQGRAILPTGDEELYPLGGLCGCWQMLVSVGMGTTVVEDAVVEVVLDFAVAAGHVYTDVDTLGVGTEGPEGGYLDLHPSFEQLFPGQ